MNRAFYDLSSVCFAELFYSTLYRIQFSSPMATSPKLQEVLQLEKRSIFQIKIKLLHWEYIPKRIPFKTVFPYRNSVLHMRVIKMNQLCYWAQKLRNSQFLILRESQNQLDQKRLLRSTKFKLHKIQQTLLCI